MPHLFCFVFIFPTPSSIIRQKIDKMNFQFKTSRCHHQGTIKPVQSITGKHAGKWVSRIKGPSVTSQGMSVKAVYSAPYIGVAKAAIAKFLKITVLEVLDEALHSLSKAEDKSSSARKMTPQKAANRMSEFDDNDEEFANFDLHAVVLSAKKQSPIPQQKNVCKSRGKMSPSNSYQHQQNYFPKNDTMESTLSTVSKVYSSTKPPHYPKNSGGKLKSPSLDSVHPGFNTTNSSSSKHAEQKETKSPDGLSKKVKRLMQEKERLLKEVNLIKQQKEEFAKESHNLGDENQRLRNESKVTEQQRDKLKGQTRAVSEEYVEVKKDLKTAK